MSGLVGAGTTATWHGDAGYDLSGVLNAPLGNAAAVRVVGYRSREGGYVDNRATGEKDINDVDIRGVRATLTAELAPDWFVDISGSVSGSTATTANMPTKMARGCRAAASSTSRSRPTSRWRAWSFGRTPERVRFRSTTGVSWQKVDENFDASANGETRQLRQRSKARALSNETRLWRPMSEGYSWLVGFSSIRHRYGVDREIGTPNGRFDLAGVENEVGETTIYGEAGVELRKGLEASFGARFTHTELSGAGEHLSPLVLVRFDDEDAERHENRFLPSASLLARPVEGLTLYARYQQGFRPGGLSIAGDTVRLYRNDRLGTAEAGFRYGRPGIDQFDLQGGATLSHWKDIQADFLDASGLPVTDNIGDGRVWTVTANGGVQGDARASPGSGLCLERRQDHQADRRIPDFACERRRQFDGDSEHRSLRRAGSCRLAHVALQRVDARGQRLRTLRWPVSPRNRSPPWRVPGRICRLPAWSCASLATGAPSPCRSPT